MKRFAICCLALIMLLLSLLSLASCGHEIEEAEAKTQTETFVLAISEKRYDDAASCMHPVRETAGGDLRQYFEVTAQNYDVDFENSFSILRYTEVKCEKNEKLYDGAYCVLTAKAKAGEKTFALTVELVKNDSGFGIHNFHFDFATE